MASLDRQVGAALGRLSGTWLARQRGGKFDAHPVLL
jgi:hypothetical protein